MHDETNEPSDDGYQKDLNQRIENDDPSLLPDSVSTDEHLQLLKALKEKEQAREQLKRLAEIDDLTGWFTRSAGLERIEKMIAEKPTAIAFFFIDIHDFKKVNDVFGHDVGDKVLRDFAQRVKGNTDSHDTCVRMGGEEFLIVSPISISFEQRKHEGQTPTKVTDEIGKRLVKVIDENIKLDDSLGHIARGAAVGATCITDPSLDDIDKGIKVVDTAMYHAKDVVKERNSLLCGVLRASYKRQRFKR